MLPVIVSKISLYGGIEGGHAILWHNLAGERSGNREVHAFSERQIAKVGKV
jgi:hypothetical protein